MIALGSAVGPVAQGAPNDRARPASLNYPSQPGQGQEADFSDVNSASAPKATTTTTATAKDSSAPASNQQASSETDRSRFSSNLYKVDKTLLSSSQVGGEYQYRLRVTAQEDIAKVHVVEHLPAGLEFVKAEPAASVAGSDLSWSFPSLAKGEVKDLLVTVRPLIEGNYVTTSKVCVDPIVALPLFAGTPKLEMTKAATGTMELGEAVSFLITVRNTGTATARNVVVRDVLPEGITSDSDLNPKLGDLQPGESREVTIVGKIKKAGPVTNTASANFDGGQPIYAHANFNVVESRLGLTMTGTNRSYIYKQANYQIVVSNPGSTVLNNVVVTDQLPAGTEFISSAPAAQAGGGRLSWTIPTLAAGKSETFNVVLTAAKPGDTVNVASVAAVASSGKKLNAEAKVSTEWEGAPGVLTEIVDTKDPVRIGESTTYEIRVTNSGSFKPVNGQFKITLSRHLRPTATSGDGQGTITGQVVTFPDVLLNPRGVTKLRIEAVGVSPGSGRARLEFNSSFLEEPVIKDESTFVY